MKQVPWTSDEEKIAFFFDNPTRPPDQHGRAGLVSVLYLLRREMISTQGYNADRTSEEVVSRRGLKVRMFASTMLMFTTLDLLAKFALGDTEPFKYAGPRFRAFVEREDGGGLTKGKGEQLWTYRNSLMHAFGLPTEDDAKRIALTQLGLGQRLTTKMRGNARALVTIATKDDRVLLYSDGLYADVVGTIRRQQEALHGGGTSDRRRVFAAMFEKYGAMWLGIMPTTTGRTKI